MSTALVYGPDRQLVPIAPAATWASHFYRNQSSPILSQRMECIFCAANRRSVRRN